MERRMQGSPCKVKGVLDEATSIKPLDDGKEAIPLLSSIQYYSKFATDQRRREHPKASLLYQSGIPRSRGKLSEDRKNSFRIIGLFQKAPSLFPSTPYYRHDKPTHKKDDEQDRCSRTTRSIGDWIGQFDIEYQPRAAIKAQMLADFIVEFTYPYKEEGLPMETWTVQTNGFAMKKVGGVGVVLISPKKRNIEVCNQIAVPSNK